MAAMIAMGGGIGGTLLLTNENTANVTAEQIADASVPAGSFTIADRDGQQRGWAKNDKQSKKLLKRAKEFKGVDPTHIDVFTAEACESGLGYEVFTADAGYASECLPTGIFPEPEDAGIVEDAGTVEEVDAGEVVPPIE